MTLKWFKLPIIEFMRETRRLSLYERGAYITLLCDYYDNGPPDINDVGTIVGDDDAKLYEDMVDLGLFTIKDGRLHHARAEQEFIDRAKNGERSKRNGTNGGGRPPKRKQTTIAELPPAVEVDDDDDPPPLPERGPPVETTSTFIGSAPPIDPNLAAVADAIGVDVEEDDDVDFRPIPESFVLSAAEIDRCRQTGASFEEIAGWFDEWKNAHLAKGTLSANWMEAWQSRFAGKMKAKGTSKPRVEVTRRA